MTSRASVGFSRTGAGEAQYAVPTKLLYTVEEAAAMLSLTRTSVFHLIGEHKLAAVKIGERRRIAHQALDDFVAQLESVSEPCQDPS